MDNSPMDKAQADPGPIEEEEPESQEVQTPLAQFAAQFQDQEEGSDAEFSYSDYHAGLPSQAGPLRGFSSMRATLRPSRRLFVDDSARSTDSDVVEWRDLPHHSWPNVVLQHIRRAGSYWAHALEKRQRMEGKGSLRLDGRLMTQAVSYSSWLSIYTDLPSLQLIVSDLSGCFFFT